MYSTVKYLICNWFIANFQPKDYLKKLNERNKTIKLETTSKQTLRVKKEDILQYC